MTDRDTVLRLAIECQLVTTGNRDGVYMQALEQFAALVAAHEREMCAKVCDDKAKNTFSAQCQVWGDYFARAIRARG